MYYGLRQCCGLVQSGTIFGAFAAKHPLGVACILIGIIEGSHDKEDMAYHQVRQQGDG